MSKRYFGTDGIRGKVGVAPITPDFVMKLGWAAGRVFSKEGRSRIVIGKDTRLSGYMFESALEAGLSAAGVDVLLIGPMPTPAIAYLARTFKCVAGIVISASHNPFEDNGIKFFSADGEKLPDAVEAAIEEMLDEPMVMVNSAALGKAKRIDDAAGRYIEFCKSTLGNHISLNGMKIVLDCAHGATYHVAPSVFQELGAEIVTTGCTPNGTNINAGVGSTDPVQLSERVLLENADLGIAFDGDGDRVVMVDHQGRLVDGDELLYLIARDLQQRGSLHGGVVGTLMSNLGLQRALERLDIPFVRAQVGDRYVMEQLTAREWWLGGEASGHIVCRYLHSTGDGIIAALQVLAALLRSSQSLAEACAEVDRVPQETINIRVAVRKDPHDLPEVAELLAEAEKRLAGVGRVLLRASGTEPKIRVTLEHSDPQMVADIGGWLATEVEKLYNNIAKGL
ncbi:phosphoglucosamine mutase [Pokkaliibacter plantistimulans]|uniref:Phosphoglucosamine mutase n=1 Tax=Proteobacteria bacterium 228 TaxID=2083153 RepID=A0A2S5KWP5_9PROT|nr:phosphoglucosamine mutase [Pokkaliibacter plantistimulans]PPC79125.1 phosphoglucosamine mutase [Pokkaliibacter plantistimulans]